MPKVSHDPKAVFADKGRMAKGSSSDYRDGFIKRVREARDGANYTQASIAKTLQISQDVYKQYETRSLLPHRLIGPFCAATRVSESWLITGQDSARPKRSSTEAKTA